MRPHSPNQVAWFEAWWPLGAVLHSSNEPSELLQWPCGHNDSTINTILVTFIIYYPSKTAAVHQKCSILYTWARPRFRTLVRGECTTPKGLMLNGSLRHLPRVGSGQRSKLLTPLKCDNCSIHRIVPVKRTGSCVMMDSRERSCSRPTCDTSMPSTSIRPPHFSVSRNSAATNDDLPNTRRNMP